MYAYEKYKIKEGQVWLAADGSNHSVTVVDTDTYKNCGDVVVQDNSKTYRIDCFKLAMVRYYNEEVDGYR